MAAGDNDGEPDMDSILAQGCASRAIHANEDRNVEHQPGDEPSTTVRDAVELAGALTTLDGYKTMAIVSDRAWVRMPDGTEDSATTGDALPRPRVRSVTQDTGVVITSTDERIDPQ